MKTAIIIITLLLLIPGQAYSQARNISGDNGLRIKYKYYFKEDSTIRGHYVDSSMCLDINGNKAIFYSEKQFLIDSTLDIAPLPITVAVNPPEEFRGTTEHSRYFIDYNSLKYVKYDRALMTHAKGHGTLEQPLWKVLDGTDTICGYPCSMAEARYLGRTWKIWYTSSIPVSAGPWLLWGAPGLILRAKDSRGLFVFHAIEAGIPRSDRTDDLTRFSENSYNLRTYRSIQKMEEVMTLVKRSYDEDMRLNGHPGGPLRATNQDGSVEMIELEMKYIPLIPENYWEKKGRKH